MRTCNFTIQNQPFLKKFFKILRRTLLIILAVIILAFIAIQTDPVQNWLAGIFTKKLSKELGTEVSIKKVSISLFNKLNLEGALIRDKQKDTLLYAGNLKVRITDWFFWKDKAELKYIGLEDAVVKMNRTDSNWNFKFIADYFSSPTPKKQSKGGIELDLKKLDLKNISFTQTDKWVGETLTARIGSLSMDADSINFNKSVFAINEIKIDAPFVRIDDYNGLRPDSLKRKNNIIDTGLQLNPNNIALHLKKLTISNGSFVVNSNEKKPVNYFDGEHLYFSKINSDFSNIILNKDTITANINIATKERSGLEVKKLKAKFKANPQIMEFAKFDLQTNKSRLTDYYAMKFKSFNADFGEYVTNVLMNVKFKEAKVNSDDIAFFAPELKSWKKEVTLSGNFTGTVADFNIKNLFAKTGNTTYVSGDVSMKGLPYMDKTKIVFTNGVLKTNYKDVSIFVPSIKNITEVNLAALGNIYFRGNYNGTISNFTTAGVFTSDIGSITANVGMQLPEKADATYKTNISIKQFNLGKFLNDSSIGVVDFDGKMSGANFSLAKLSVNIEGKINSIEYSGYKYSNITTKGIFQKKYFNSELKIDDPNISFNSQAIIDLTKDKPAFNILGDLSKMNLKSLHFLKDSVSLTGLLDVNFSGTNIDNFLGTAKFLNATVATKNGSISFDSVSLASEYTDSSKYLKLISNNITATVAGQFTILSLPNSFQVFLHKYYPSYFSAPETIPPNQDFTVTINTGYVEPVLQLFDKKISGLNDVSIKGSVNTKRNNFSVDVKVPYVKYDNNTITGVDINGKGNLDSLNITGLVSTFSAGDSMMFPDTKFKIVSGYDHSTVSIKTSANNTLNEADLNADLITYPDGVYILFNPSSFILNNKKWNLENEGELTLRKRNIHAENVRFTQGFQEIDVTTDKDEGDSSNLKINMKNVVLGDLTSLFMKNPKLEGIVTGETHLHDIFTNFNAETNLRAEQFRIDNDSIGLVNIHSNFDSKTGEIPFKVESINKGYNFSVDGKYNIKDSVNEPLFVNARLDSANISYLNIFLGDVFSDVKGEARGNLIVKGNPSSPQFSGRVKLYKGGIKVKYTQVYYSIDSADIKFEDDGIDFGEFTIKDTLNNSGIVKGKLYEKGFKNMNFDFTLATDKLLLINTKATDNQPFYGNAIGKASLRMSGPETNCKMTIVAESNDISHIYIPITSSKQSGDADFIVFKQIGTEMEDTKSNSSFNLSVDLDITANNKTQIDVILDELTGDVIKANGNGRLRINAGTSEPLTIRGRYVIETGSYDFNFQSFIRKPFIFEPATNNYIEWSGDPFNANLNITAKYIANRVTVGDLISNQQGSFNNSTKAYVGDVYVMTELTGKLNAIEPKFRIDFPTGSTVKNDPLFTDFVEKNINGSKDEALKQSTYVIVLNSFAPYGANGGGGAINYTATTVNTISQLLLGQANKIVTSFLDKIGLRGVKFDANYSLYDNADMFGQSLSSTSSGRYGNRIDLKVAKSFFNDRVIVTFGTGIDINSAYANVQNGNVQWLPDVNVELVLAKDNANTERLSALIFSRNSLDYSNTTTALGKRSSQGIGLSYKKDFEKFFKKKAKDSTAQQQNNSTNSNNKPSSKNKTNNNAKEAKNEEDVQFKSTSAETKPIN